MKARGAAVGRPTAARWAFRRIGVPPMTYLEIPLSTSAKLGDDELIVEHFYSTPDRIEKLSKCLSINPTKLLALRVEAPSLGSKNKLGYGINDELAEFGCRLRQAQGELNGSKKPPAVSAAFYGMRPITVRTIIPFNSAHFPFVFGMYRIFSHGKSCTS